MMDTVSIIICTHNRASLLKDTLCTLVASIRAFGGPAEVLIIDNNSTDDTPTVTERFSAEHPDIRAQYYRERQQGLSHARNSGIRLAKGGLICFLDDDVLVPECWLTEIVATLALDAQIGCIAGRIKLHWPPGSVPSWIDRKYYGFYSQYEKGDFSCALPIGEGFYGANFALTRRAVNRVGYFNPDLGRIGMLLLSGEDSEYAERLAREGIVVAYAAHGYVHHRVAPERLTFRWLYARYFWQGVSWYYYPRNCRLRSALAWLPKLLSNLLILPFVAPFSRKFTFRTCFRIANALGPFYGWYSQLRRQRDTRPVQDVNWSKSKQKSYIA